MPSSIGFIKNGKLRAIGVSAGQRSPALPDVPTIAEGGLPGFSVLDWQGLFATARTSPEIVKKLNVEVIRIFALPDVVERLTAAGVEIRTSSSEDWGNFVKSEIAKWAKVVKAAGVKVE
jgi:tripartite-type tricarboxylate transporter receptor subunit TctC